MLSLVWLVPQWYPVARAAAPPSGAVSLRLFDANVEYSNPSLVGIAAGLTVTAYRTGVGRGSDHHPVMAEPAVTPAA